MRVLVTGSRQMLSQGRVYRELDALYFERWHPYAPLFERFTVIHGGAPGADSLAAQWCHDRREHMVEQEVHPAQWAHYGKLAGGIRNGEMVRAGADIVLAFFQPGAQNRGTRNCVEQARLAGLEVKEMWE